MFSTKHTRDTENPQDYLEHFKVAFLGSLNLIWAGFAGIVHAFIPTLFPFYTSSCIIKAFKSLVKSKRHKKELNMLLGKDFKL